MEQRTAFQIGCNLYKKRMLMTDCITKETIHRLLDNVELACVAKNKLEYEGFSSVHDYTRSIRLRLSGETPLFTILYVIFRSCIANDIQIDEIMCEDPPNYIIAKTQNEMEKYLQLYPSELYRL